MTPPASTTDPPPHSGLDDVQGIVTGTLMAAFGVTLLRDAKLLAGGTAGLAFLVHYGAGWPFGLAYALLNAPFYGLALRELGRAFTLKTFAAIALLSVASEAMPRFLAIDRIDPLFAAVMGGCLIGVGLLILFRHHASLGGFNILAVWLQRRRGWRAGWIQLALDSAILVAAWVMTDPRRVALSLLGALVLNGVLALNHRPGRYPGA